MSRIVFHPVFIAVEVAPGNFQAFEFHQYGVTSEGLLIRDIDGYETKFSHDEYISFHPMTLEQVEALTPPPEDEE